jgi:hypothetical protein
MTDHEETDQQPGEIRLARTRSLAAVTQGPEPLITEISEPRAGAGLPPTVRKEVKLIEATEHALLLRLAKRHGKPMSIMLKDMMMRGLRLQEAIDDGGEVVVMKGRSILYKILA